MKVLVGFMLLGLLLLSVSGFASSIYSNGEIDDDLQFEDFKIGDNGFLTGFIVNTSKRTRQAVKLDAWTTNTQETQIYWRKTLNLGDIAPGARISVKEPYQVDRENLSKTKFMFRVPRPGSFRNK